MVLGDGDPILPWLSETVPASSQSVELLWVAAPAPGPPNTEHLLLLLSPAGCFCGVVHMDTLLGGFAQLWGVPELHHSLVSSALGCPNIPGLHPQPAPTPQCRCCSTQTLPRTVQSSSLPLLRSGAVNLMHLGRLSGCSLRSRLG